MDRTWQLSENVRVTVRAVGVHCVHRRDYARGSVLPKVTVGDIELCICVGAAKNDLRAGCGGIDEPAAERNIVLPCRVLYPNPSRRLSRNRGVVEETVRERRSGKRRTGSHWLYESSQLD